MLPDEAADWFWSMSCKIKKMLSKIEKRAFWEINLNNIFLICSQIKCLDVNQRRRYKDAKLYQSYIKQSFPWSTSSSSTVSFSGSCTVSSWASCTVSSRASCTVSSCASFTVSSRASCTVSSWGSWRVSSWMSWEGSGLPLVTAEASPGWIK